MRVNARPRPCQKHKNPGEEEEDSPVSAAAVYRPGPGPEPCKTTKGQVIKIDELDANTLYLHSWQQAHDYHGVGRNLRTAWSFVQAEGILIHALPLNIP